MTEETIKNKRGEVDASLKEEPMSVSMEYSLNEFDWDDGDEDIKEVVEEIQQMSFANPYVQPYLDKLQTSYVLYGRDGVKTQLGYIASNCEDDEKAKKIIQLKKRI